MKKFKFKLHTLLQLREFKENQTKMELGQINQKIVAVEERLKSLHTSLDQSYHGMHEAAKDGSFGLEISFYPQYQDSLRADILKNQNHLHSLQYQYLTKMRELQKHRAEVKVLENLKEKDLLEHKKSVNKEVENKIFENYQLTNFSSKYGGEDHEN